MVCPAANATAGQLTQKWYCRMTDTKKMFFLAYYAMFCYCGIIAIVMAITMPIKYVSF